MKCGNKRVKYEKNPFIVNELCQIGVCNGQMKEEQLGEVFGTDEI